MTFGCLCVCGESVLNGCGSFYDFLLVLCMTTMMRIVGRADG